MRLIKKISEKFELFVKRMLRFDKICIECDLCGQMMKNMSGIFLSFIDHSQSAAYAIQ